MTRWGARFTVLRREITATIRNLRFAPRLTASLLLCPAVALPANVWINDMPLTSVIGLPSGAFILTGPENSAPACGANGSQFYVQVNQNAQTAEGLRVAIATSLTALAAGNVLTLLYDNSSSSCFVQVVQIKAQ
jgi:hypothetical protein